ncbi:anaphase-promoting complex, subunit 5 [Scheffersomyces xylosifermentans]|uniref:anaphase-promoting complex, subunit 5 n=1 Tax=Scheffersomyces xylosifermentans TaxID=1304137 RepID=UPI00315DE5C6
MSEAGGNIKLLLTEDLSPHKIAMMFLLQIYCHNEIPIKRIKPVLTTLIKFVENETLYDENDKIIVMPTLSNFCYCLDTALIEAVQPGRSQQNPTIAVHADSRKLQKRILKSLWDIDSVESLDYHITSCFAMLVTPNVIFKSPSRNKRISSRSLLGKFIHKITTAFKLLKFDEVFLLYEAFVEYRASSREIYINYGGSIADINTDSIPSQLGQSSQGESELNTSINDDLILFSKLNAQLKGNIGFDIPTSSQSIVERNVQLVLVPKHDLQILLERQIGLLETYGTRTPQMLKDIMRLMTSPNSNTCSIQNINFNNLPSYYYIKYLESLHSCDYNGAFEALHQYFDYMVSNNSKYFYHFALISRASLHQFFGEDEKAIDAIEEAISVARENKDNSTLTYILSWLFNFMKNKPELWNRQSFYNNNSESQLLNFLIKKSQSVSLSLYSMSYNFETLQIMNNGGSMTSYLESLLKASYISINDQIPTFVRSMELTATVWSRIGNPILCDAYIDILLESTEKKDDRVSVKVRSNFLRFLKGETNAAYKDLSKLKNQIGKTDYSLLNSIQTRSLIMSIKLNLLKGRFKVCKEIIDVLISNETKEIELSNELRLIQVEVEIELQNYSRALKLIADQLNSLSNSDTYLTIKLNLLKCKIYTISGNHSKSLVLIIQQIQQGKKVGFITIVVEGLVLLVTTLNKLGYYQDGYDIFTEIFPMILGTGHKEIISQAYLDLAQICYQMHCANKDEECFQRTLKFLSLSIKGFNRSANLIKLIEAFSFEKEIATSIADESLKDHATRNLEILRSKSVEESSHGFVLLNY